MSSKSFNNMAVMNYLLLLAIFLLALVSPILSASIGDQSATSTPKRIPRWYDIAPYGYGISCANYTRYEYSGLWRTSTEYNDRFGSIFNDQRTLCPHCSQLIGRELTERATCGCLYHQRCLITAKRADVS